MNWRLYDKNGRLMHRKGFSNQTIHELLPPIAAGVYVVEVRMGNRVERTRITKTN